MTQTEQTYNRIAALIFAAIRANPATFLEVDKAAQTIAAEIDGLRAQLADARAALATRTDERDAALGLIKSHHDARNAAIHERDEARQAYATMRDSEDEWKRDVTSQLADARAQLAALTPRAKAWDAEQAYLRIGVRWDYEGGDPAPMIDALDRFRAAAARAREMTP